MVSNARTDDAVYVTGKALARLGNLVTVEGIDPALITAARREMDALLSNADAAWQARDSVRQAIDTTDDFADLDLPPVAAIAGLARAPAAIAPGFHESDPSAEEPPASTD